MHWTGAPPFDYVQTGDPASLFSITTTASEAITAGDVTQLGNGALYENTGSGWQTAALEVPYAWRGLTSRTDQVYAVGDLGLIARRDGAGAWSLIDQSLIQESFHAAWIDPDGGFWGVGGEFGTPTTMTTDGFLLYYGTGHVRPVTQ